MIKNFVSIAGFVLATAFSSHAQTVQDIFGKTNVPVTWYGIDYSHSKIVGSIASFGGTSPVSPTDLRDNYYHAWNYLILEEPDKFDIAKMIQHRFVEKDLSMVKKLNAAATLDSIEVVTTPYYSPKEIQDFVSAYPIETKTSGIGLIFITESMNKLKSEAYYHVVFFNTTTKEVLLQERFRGAAFGMRTRNYWAGSYYSVMEYVREDAYPKWRKKYAPNTVDTSAPKW